MRSLRGSTPAWLMVLLLIAACRTGRNYPDANGPRYVGGPLPVSAVRVSSDTLRLVSFNVAFSRQIDTAIALLTSHPQLRDADIVFLQEMDADGTRRIANALHLFYVYYPAIYHTRERKDFGNAVLSRWPIIEDAKIPLPHRSRYAGTQRIATAATIRAGERTLRLYSTHLGTIADIRGSRRRDQLRAIFADAERYERVIVAGDMNASDVGDVAAAAGYSWPTQRGAKTTRFARWDHVFLKGLATPDSAGEGTVLDAYRASDHHPIWARAIMR